MRQFPGNDRGDGNRQGLRGLMVTWLHVISLGMAALLSIGRSLGDEPTARLKLAFVSNREHYWYPHVYLYEHDGRSAGKITGRINPQDKRLDHQPVLSGDGTLCVFGAEFEGQVGLIQFWDVPKNAARDVGDLFKTPHAVFSPSLTADGAMLAVSVWNRPGTSARWDVLLYDLTKKQSLELPGVNTSKYDERRVAVSGDGRRLAFTTNSPGGRGLTDVRLYDRESNEVRALRDVNSAAADTYPSLDGDGQLLCFASDREAGSGGLDIYLYDLGQQQFIPLPGLNSPGHEQTPSITHDGRYIAFVSERLDSAGEHDIFIYDRQASSLLATPGLNTDRDDFDPCLVLLPRGGE